MKRLRLLAFDASGVTERTYSTFPVRIGRHPENELQISDPRISRFHAQLSSESDALVFRDVSSQSGTIVTVGSSAAVQVVRGGEVRAPGGQLTVLVGGVRLEASIEDGDEADLPASFAPAMRDAAQAIVTACELQQECASEDIDAIRPVLDALFDGLLMLRFGLHAEEIASAGKQDGEPARKEAASALLEWAHASEGALRLVEQSIEGHRSVTAPSAKVSRRA